MNSNFMNIVAKATESKSLFDSSVESIKDALDASVKVTPSVHPHARKAHAATGWLRGALSYPWALVCFFIPSIKDLL